MATENKPQAANPFDALATEEVVELPAGKKKSKKVVAAGSAPPKNETLKRLGLTDPREAILCLPDSYSDARVPHYVIPESDDENRKLYNLRFTGELEGIDKDKKQCDLKTANGWSKTFRLKIGLVDDEGNTLSYSVFGNPWPWRNVEEGEYFNLVGKVVYFGYANPQAFLIEVEVPPAHAIGKIWVKYTGIQGRVAGEKVEALARSQLDNPDAFRHCATKLIGALGQVAKDALEDAGAGDIYNTFEELLQDLHTPETPEDGLLAKVVANKLAAMAIKASALRHNLRQPHHDAPLSVDVNDIDRLIKTQKEKYTEGQISVARDIGAMLRQPKPMNALLSGDVGTGKTLPYVTCAVAAHLAGAKVAVIAPTSILADQLYKEFVTRFGTHIKGVQRIQAGGKIEDHAYILVGTPGLTSVAKKSKYAPNFIIFDEQHKLSTAVREQLVKPWTHTLDVSATPIPRSLASALFGGKVILNLRECPVVKTFDCFIGDLSMRPAFVAMIKHALMNGERAAIVYPRVNASVTYSANEEGEMIKREMESVISGAAAFEKAFPGQVIAVHGGMEEDDIVEAIKLVRSGERPIVVASTVIETGVDIPGISTMIVRDADYFGISQLHQLRGRLVRRGGHGLFAMMVSTPKLEDLNEESTTRLNAIKNSTDGYYLAEVDLLNRNIGEMGDTHGGNQSGATLETVFRLVKLGPQDFLKTKLSKESLDSRPVSESAMKALDKQEAQEKTARGLQPRLFG